VTRVRSLRVTSACLFALALGGCAQTAVLELQVMVPARDPAATEPVYAFVQVRQAATNPFEDSWLDQGDAAEVPLRDEPTRIQLSVIGRDPDTDLHVKVRFCEHPRCMGFEDRNAERWFSLQHPFYLGRRTAWATCIETIPTSRPAAPFEVERCQIHGCAVGSATNYCDEGGAHFCETGDDDELPNDLRCVGSLAEF
jgi:hypothetical protein